MRQFLSVAFAILFSLPAWALDLSAPFSSIDEGEIRLFDWQGRPVLVVNTASQCGYTTQFTGLQALYDRYRAQGLVVLAVPSDDFNQELSSNRAVKEFCELTYGINLPMTEITHVRGRKAHPFYASLRKEIGFRPNWNFNKVLLSPDGQVVGVYGSNTRPLDPAITQRVEALLN